MSVTLQNPHSIIAAFDRRPNDVLDLRVASTAAKGAWHDVIQLAEQYRVSVCIEKPAKQSHGKSPERKFGRQGNQLATIREKPQESLQSLFSLPKQAQKSFGVWLALDRLQDPHNVGAIFRTAAFFGVRGIVLTKNQSAPMTNIVYDVASGGVEYVPFVFVSNLSQALINAKQRKLWVVGSSEHAENNFLDLKKDRHWLIVIGNEESGLRRLTLENCDEACRLNSQSEIGSLNVSVAAAIMISHLS